MLHNAVVLYRRTITFSYIVLANHKSPRLRIPNVRGAMKGEGGPLAQLVEYAVQWSFRATAQWLPVSLVAMAAWAALARCGGAG